MSSIVLVLSIAYTFSGFAPATNASEHMDGQAVFRFDTFGDEHLWTDVLRMHKPISTVDPGAGRSAGRSG